MSERVNDTDFRHTAEVRSLTERLQRRGVTQDEITAFAPILLAAAVHSPDADRALTSFARWFAALETPFVYLSLLQQPGILERFCLVTGCSQYFADLLARNPDDFDVIVHPEKYGERETPAHRYREISLLMENCDTPEQQRDALRRWKAREMLQIGVRDLMGLDDMPVTAREFSNLADACVQMALDMALESFGNGVSIPNPLAVFALGKLGGQELNYSSDIDLIFVHQDGLLSTIFHADERSLETPVYLSRLAETIIGVLAEETAQGHVFRVDMRLRPEGRFGPLTRSLTGYRVYYEKWAENWERQALLKARFVAGNRALGEAFSRIIAPIVYRRQISGAFLNDIRVNKRRIEQTCIRKGEEQTNIKTGYGGIRDIEFIVQLLQMEFGYTQPRLRTPNTLTALTRLNEANFLTDRDTEELGGDYLWLRALEHRLQLLHNAQTQTLPPAANEAERYRLARRMGYETREAFEADLAARRNRVHAHLNALFYDQDRRFFPALASEVDALWQGIGELLQTLDAPHSQAEAGMRLTKAGLQDVPNALRLLNLLRHSEEFRDSPPQVSERFIALAPHLLDMAANSPDPDAALSGIESLAVPYRDTLYSTFQARPDLMWRVIRLASVPPLIRQLARHQEWMVPLFSSDETVPKAVSETAEEAAVSAFDTLQSAHHIKELSRRIAGLNSRDAQLKMMAFFYQRERLRIAARDVWNEADVADVMTRLTRLAEAMLQIVLTYCIENRAAAHADPDFARRALAKIAVLGLGRLGGAELNYGSDWDLLFVYDVERPRPLSEPQGERHNLAAGVVQDFLSAIDALNMRGANIEVDLRLRPWGRQGGVIYSLRGYVDYFRSHAEMWERQAALKARFVAGNPHVGRRLERALRAVSGGRGVTPAEDIAIQAMKRRIENERLKPQERATDLKLGNGGLSDIEWLTQRLQLKHGPTSLAVRVPGTLPPLYALEAIGALARSEVDILADAYRLLTRVRNAMTLLAGKPQDIFPADPAHRRVLARLLEYQDSVLLRAEAVLQEAVQADMLEVRRIFEHRFL